MNTCKTCKHWMPKEKQYLTKDLNINIGECSLVDGDEGIENDRQLAACKTYGGYGGATASLQTAENFGCVLWKAFEVGDPTIEGTA